VRDGSNNDTQSAIGLQLAGQDDCTGPVLLTFLLPASGFRIPKIAVSDHKPWNWIG
jgi:hypothetical protein